MPNTHQNSVLEAAFSQSSSLNKKRLKQLAQQTGLNIPKIMNWFWYKRRTTKNEMKKSILSKEEGTETNG